MDHSYISNSNRPMKTFKKFLIYSVIILLTVVAIDKSIGLMLDYLWRSIPVTQDMGKAQYARNEVCTDIVVIGSSRAAHHYNVNAISERMGLSSYNVGLDGCFFLDNCCVMHSLMERYSPKIIILEIAEDAMYAEAVNHLEGLYNYYWSDPYVRGIVNQEEGWQAAVKLSSSLYRHNANSFKILGYGVKGLLAGKQADVLNGYAPIEYREKLCELELSDNESNLTFLTLSEWKMELLRNLLTTAGDKDIDVFVVTSPSFHSPGSFFSSSTEKISEICTQCGFSYWNYTSESEFLEHPEWFNDGAHLNEVGADVFTKIVVDRIIGEYR